MSELITDIHPPIGRVVINRPERRNAISSRMWQDLQTLAERLAADAALKVVTIEGAGDAAFSAGADIIEMQQGLADPLRMQVMQQAVLDAQVAWERLPMPTLAVIRGACTGGGCGLALACDLRLATPDAFFAIPPARLGLAYSLADTKRLQDLVGPSRAKEILFTGRRILAFEARELGLINEIVAAEALEARAIALAREIAGNASNSVRAAKAVVNMISAGVLAETAESRRYYDESFSSPEFLEGARAFIEKRPPRF
ncbi:MAG: enoyl-CoA hydratase/isomerase family protein [Gammaproteobacteria bacterium]|nr:enoyl-CoA hydratase/isomerase family protein [Gammaproteobacteria bacterium]